MLATRVKFGLSTALAGVMPAILAAAALTSPVNAQTATNTARVAAPVGAIETNTTNNEATDSDTIVGLLFASNDSVTDIDGLLGATAVVNAFSTVSMVWNGATMVPVRDTVNGSSATPANATVSAVSVVPPGLTFNTTTGDVDVAPGTEAGTYTFNYRLCELANPTNCTTATISVTVASPTITADADSVTGVNGAAGAADVLDVLDGDTLNGVPVTISTVDLRVVTAATSVGGAPVPVLGADGQIDVPANTPAGTYSIVYEICDKVNAAVCATATATVTVFPTYDLLITKTNTPGQNGNVDLPTDTLTQGVPTTYTITVTNNGPDAVTGATVTDTPVNGLQCPATNVVTITGSGVPSASFTMADLLGTGIVLGTLANGQSATLTFECQPVIPADGSGGEP